MKEYFIDSSRKNYKITESGEIFSKFKYETEFIKMDYKHNQITIGTGYIDKKIFFYQLYHNYSVKKNEKVIFIDAKNGYTIDNLLLVKKKRDEPEFFKSHNKKVLHYDVKNNLIGTFNSQYECEFNTGISQSIISSSILRGKRINDGSYFIYEGEKLKKLPKNIRLINIRGDKIKLYQLSLDNKIINRFDSIQTAIEYLNLPSDATSHIVKCCKLKRSVAYGFKWRSDDTKDRIRLKKMLCYYEFDKLKYIFNSRKEITEKLGLHKSDISLIINGFIGKNMNYNIIEVSYEKGIILKKKLGEITSYQRCIKHIIKPVILYDSNDKVVKKFITYSDICEYFNLTKNSIYRKLINKKIMKDGSYILYETDSIDDLNDYMFLYFVNGILENYAYSINELCKKTNLSIFNIQKIIDNPNDKKIKKMKYSEAKKIINESIKKA